MLIITARQHISPEGLVMVLYSYNEPTATHFNVSTKNIKLTVKEVVYYCICNAVDET
jgi:hypothetical protein